MKIRLAPTGQLLANDEFVPVLSNVRVVDGGTTLPLSEQSGSFISPFSTVQAAVDSLAGVSGGLVLIAPGTYNEAVIVSSFVRLQALFLDQATGSPVTITSITKIANAALDLVGITATTLTTLVSGGAVGLFQSTVGTLAAALSVITARGCTFSSAFTALSLFTVDNCVFLGLITLASTTATSTFSNGCTFGGAADIVGGGGTCTVQMDADSMFLFKNAANTFTTVANIIVRTSMARAAVSVTVPVLLAGVLGDAAPVTLVGTELAGTGTGTGIAVTDPSAGITGGGACIGCRVSAGNTLVFKFIGPTTGGAQTFVVAKLTSGT
jgi:hypothetical protein